MAANYKPWEEGAEFLESLRADGARLQEFLGRHSADERRQMADGLASYMTTAFERDPNALPMGLSETIDNFRKHGTRDDDIVPGLLKGVKNDFYNLFSKHPNIMMTTGGLLGFGAGLGLINHYGLGLKRDNPIGWTLVSIGGLIFQSEKVASFATGPARKKMDAEDHSLGAKLATSLDAEVPKGAFVPEGMDPLSPEGRMVNESGKTVSKLFEGIVKHREMLISNILVAGEGAQTAGLVSNAYLDKKYKGGLDPIELKKAKTTAHGGISNSASNTILAGMTYYNRYIDGPLQELDKNSPTYKEDRAKIWADAPNGYFFSLGRIFARVLAPLPESVRAAMPLIAIGTSAQPLFGMMNEAITHKPLAAQDLGEYWKGKPITATIGGESRNIKPFQFFGALGVLVSMVIGYTSITARNRPQKVMSPEEVKQFAGVVGEASKEHQSPDEATRRAEMDELKQTIMSQTFIAPQHEGLVEQTLSQHFGLPFTVVRDHTKKMPASREPSILPASHTVVHTVQDLGATEADLTQDGLTLHFTQMPPATRKAIDGINALVMDKSNAHALKARGVEAVMSGGGEVKINARMLPMLTRVTGELAQNPQVGLLNPDDIANVLRQSLLTRPETPAPFSSRTPPAGVGAGAQR